MEETSHWNEVDWLCSYLLDGNVLTAEQCLQVIGALQEGGVEVTVESFLGTMITEETDADTVAWLKNAAEAALAEAMRRFLAEDPALLLHHGNCADCAKMRGRIRK